MNEPSQNPTLNLETNGRRRRHIIHSEAVRTFKSDRGTEQNVTTLRRWLDGQKVGDVVSMSMLARRALSLYASHVTALSDDPEALAGERSAVRQGTRLPRLRRQEPPLKKPSVKAGEIAP